MSAPAVSLEHVLATRTENKPNVDLIGVGDMKHLGRFWFGVTAANKFRGQEGHRALKELLKNRTQVEERVRSLPENQQQVLSVCMRYGGNVSGPVLLAELLARGLVEKPKPGVYNPGASRKEDPVHALMDKMLLVHPYGGYHRMPSYGYGYGYGYRLSYPDLGVLPAVRDLIRPAASLPWRPSAPAAAPTSTTRHVVAEGVLDLWTTAQALAVVQTWKINRGGTLPKSMLNRLAKLFAWPEHDPLLPPDLPALDYEILRGLGASGMRTISLRSTSRWSKVACAGRPRSRPGTGCMPGSEANSGRTASAPSRTETATATRCGSIRDACGPHRLLVWALCRLAHGTEEWFDLETFLGDLWCAAGDDIDFYWGTYSWHPQFKSAGKKDAIPAGPERMFAFWLDMEGGWAANALLGTLVYLGLVERGQKGPGRNAQHSFRLTPLGKAVFGAPEIAVSQPEHDPKFLTIQPNHEVFLYLDTADPSKVWPLAQMTRRVSAPGGLVQTFALTRESVYQALESGLSAAEMERFLQEHSKTGLPANVSRSLAEWSQHREALVLHVDVLLGAIPPSAGIPRKPSPKGNSLASNSSSCPGRRHAITRIIPGWTTGPSASPCSTSRKTAGSTW